LHTLKFKALSLVCVKIVDQFAVIIDGVSGESNAIGSVRPFVSTRLNQLTFFVCI